MREPLGSNPVLNHFRYLPPSIRSMDEKPLSFSDIELIRAKFASATLEFHSFISLLLLPLGILINILPPKVDLKVPINLLGGLDVYLGKFPL